jgi:hypothetical protein
MAFQLLSRLPRIFAAPLPQQEPARVTAPQADRPRRYRDVPPLRQEPYTPDEFDGQRVLYARKLWTSQDHLLRARDRQIEENIRMICGQQWSIWSELAGKFIDISRYLTDEERRWRQFPVMNRLLLWFMLVHARMTENPPTITFNVVTGDRIDSEFAEVMDAIFKHVWNEASMLDVIDLMTSWLIPSGTVYLQSRIDPNGGDLRVFRAPTTLALLNPDGTPVLGADGLPIQREIPDAPYDSEGNLLGQLDPQTGEFRASGQPHVMREGAIAVDVLSALEVRGQWGPQPWHKKRWHQKRTYYTPEEFYELYGLDLEPEVVGETAEDIAELQRILYGTGFFGAAGGREENLAHAINPAREGFIECFETWFAPSDFPGMEETEESPGGRLLVTTRTKVVRDGARFAAFRYTSPIRQFNFVRVPGRPSGTSPQEMLNGPIRSRNRYLAQILEHGNKVANPIRIVDMNSGIQEGQITNRPGQEIRADLSQVRGEPVRYVVPPTMPPDVYRILDILKTEFDDLANIPGALGTPPSTDPSGELVKELRFNADRFIGPTQRRTVTELARMAEDWVPLLQIIWDEQKILRVVGEDGIARTITVLPMMFERSTIHAIPDIESMLPEGRGERIERVFRLFERGLLGDPASPITRDFVLDLAKFPHMSRATRPGGADRSTAEQNVGKLLQGVPAQRIPIFEWYDHQLHLFVLEKYMKSPEYLRQPPLIQEQFVIFRDMLLMAMQEAFRKQVALQAMQQATAAQAQLALAGATNEEARARGLAAEEQPSETAAAGGA